MPWKEPTPLAPPLRSPENGHGTIGKPIRLDTNHFPMTFAKHDLMLCQYDVTITDYLGKTDRKISKARKKVVFENLKSCDDDFKKPLAYDREKSAYGVGVIPALKNKKPKEYKVTVISEDGNLRATPNDKINKRSQFTVTLKLTVTANLKNLLDSFKNGGCTKENSSLIQMVDVMFRHYRAYKYLEESISKRKFFSLNEEFGRSFDISGDKHVFAGFIASPRPTAWKNEFSLIVNNSHTVGYKEQPVINFLEVNLRKVDFDLQKPLTDSARESAGHHLIGLKVKVTHTPIKRSYTVRGLTSEGASSLTFELEEEDKDGKKTKKKVTVSQYFKDRYRMVLKYPNASCLRVGDRDNYIPLEVCEIKEGQKVKKMLSDSEAAEMIKRATMAPDEKLKNIKSIVRKNKFGEDPMLNALGCSISDEPLRIKGRILPKPSLAMKEEKFIPYLGSWKVNDKKFHIASDLTDWAVINYDGNTDIDQIRAFLKKLTTIGRELGMTIEDPFNIWEGSGSGPLDPKKDFCEFEEENPKVQLVMCILPNKRIYGSIKKAGDFDVRLLTSCVQGKNVGKCHTVTITNILLKINAKLGGINNIFGIEEIPMFKEPILVLGADVNHPPAGPPGDNPVPSFAAVVGSINLTATKYATAVRAQARRSEVILGMTEIVRNHLLTFYKKTGQKPEKIIMFRDGVSESQFQSVLQMEMMKIRDACTSLDASYQPGITFICVQKRHQTRLFCVDPKDGVGNGGNVPPGTVVDNDITHPTETDYFLNSHQGIQGTSRPAHYHVLWDDNDLSMNDLQAYTYRLCHVYARCSKSVSIPTPTYYAHWAAYRAKMYANEAGLGIDNTLEDYQQCARVASVPKFSGVPYYL